MNLVAGILSGLLLAGTIFSSITGIAGVPAANGSSKSTPGLLAALVTPAQTSAATGPNYLHTEGSKIVDSKGNVVEITGINWFGMETESFAPHGLWSRNYEDMLDQIAAMGFNTIRLPYSNELFDAKSVPNGIDYKLNPDLEGLKGIEIMDKIVDAAGKRGLRIILDQHRPDKNGQSNLWYTPKLSEEQWISDWKMLAEHYQGNDTVIGADLHNEPHGEATWGTGEVKTDWRLAAERGGNAILGVNPNWLIIVEGVDNYQGKGYWWGGDLSAAGQNPVRLDVPNQLVYSAHDYGPGVFNQSWFQASNFPNNMSQIWDSHWGYLAEQDIAPVILGEFGGKSVSENTTEGVWQHTLINYLKDNGISYTYWSLNPNSGDTGGVLNDDWTTVNQGKENMLATYQAPLVGKTGVAPAKNEATTQPEAKAKPEVQSEDSNQHTNDAKAESPKVDANTSASPSPTPTNTTSDNTANAAGSPVTPDNTDNTANTVTVSQSGLEIQSRTNKRDTISNNPSPEFKIVNKGATPISLSDVEIRYWYKSDSSGQGQQIVDLDWTSVGGSNVVFSTPTTDKGTQNHYLSVTFKKDAGVLQPKGEAEVKVRIHTPDWSNFDQSSAYSFGGQDTYGANQKITAYVKGNLVWGQEPAANNLK